MVNFEQVPASGGGEIALHVAVLVSATRKIQSHYVHICCSFILCAFLLGDFASTPEYYSKLFCISS